MGPKVADHFSSFELFKIFTDVGKPSISGSVNISNFSEFNLSERSVSYKSFAAGVKFTC